MTEYRHIYPTSHPAIFYIFLKQIDKIPKCEILRNSEISLKLIIHRKLLPALSEWFVDIKIYDVKTMKNGKYGVRRTTLREGDIIDDLQLCMQNNMSC